MTSRCYGRGVKPLEIDRSCINTRKQTTTRLLSQCTTRRGVEAATSSDKAGVVCVELVLDKHFSRLASSAMVATLDGVMPPLRAARAVAVSGDGKQRHRAACTTKSSAPPLAGKNDGSGGEQHGDGEQDGPLRHLRRSIVPIRQKRRRLAVFRFSSARAALST
ncbi:hypothetical protein PHYPSEUDO_009483, partial [Phytophthora pseudosyringae]